MKLNKKIIIWIGIAIAVVVGIGIYFLLSGDSGSVVEVAKSNAIPPPPALPK